MGRNFSFYLQHIGIHHYHISNCYLSASVDIAEVFLGIWGQLADQHDAHTLWITRKSECSLTVQYLPILVELEEFQTVPFHLLHSLYVLI